MLPVAKERQSIMRKSNRISIADAISISEIKTNYKPDAI